MKKLVIIIIILLLILIGMVVYRNTAIKSNNQVNVQDDEKIETPELQVTVQLRDMGQLFLIGIAIVTVSAGISSITVMRLKPREILSKMS